MLFLYLPFNLDQLNIGTYNVHGLNSPALSYIDKIMANYDFLFIQEHWLHSSQLHLFEDKIKHIHSYGISGMDECKLHSGRPYGGCAILWRDTLSCKVTPILSDSTRLCMVKVEFTTYTIMLCTVYMPCDSDYDQYNNSIYNCVLQELIKHVNDESIDFVICGGDFNTDMCRVNSLHTKSLQTFMDNENFKLCDSHPFNKVDYTYESLSNGTKSTLDHFIVSENMFQFICDVSVVHDIDNISDHSILSTSFNISIEYSHTAVQNEAKLLWASATANDIDQYRNNIDNLLENIVIDPDVLCCTNHQCTAHHDAILSLHDNIISSCLDASKCIPTKKSMNHNPKKSIPGWKEFVKPYRSDALFWHALWKDNGSPSAGYLADIRRRTRYKYHNVLRKVRQQEKHIQAIRMAENLDGCQYADFWANIKKMKGNKSCFPTTVDSAGDVESIGSLFHEKYKNLYNCVSYDEHQMAALKQDIDYQIYEHDDCAKPCVEHCVSVANVTECVAKLKRGKHDGNRGHFSDHIINGTPRLYIYLSLLFNSMLSHGCVPNDFLISTLVPIPKNKRKSINNSENYRAIALSSILGKLLDNILLVNCSSAFQTSDLQYGFKQCHSTNQCTFVVNEVIQYYTNNYSNVYITLIDASKAFDRVQYVKLLKLLLSKNVCPLVARFLCVMYTTQSFRVKWCNHITELTRASNGVKQGGVISPLLSTIYIDVLLCRLQQSGFGCYIGNNFCGSMGYADDVILLAPTVTGMKHMLQICTQYGMEYNVLFNPDKTKLIHINNINCNISPNICFMSKHIESVSFEKHLGFPIGNVNSQLIISQAVNQFIGKVNMVISHFKCLRYDIMYKLFKTYCMPLYGCPLWDFTSKIINKFYVAWRKSMRRILNIPRTTHCVLLNEICDDMSVQDQLYIRFINFYKSLINSGNNITQTCAKLALQGSNSVVSNNITIISRHMAKSRFEITLVNKSHFHNNVTISDEASVIRDILHMKHYNMFTPTCSQLLNQDELDFMLMTLCTM